MTTVGWLLGSKSADKIKDFVGLDFKNHSVVVTDKKQLDEKRRNFYLSDKRPIGKISPTTTFKLATFDEIVQQDFDKRIALSIQSLKQCGFEGRINLLLEEIFCLSIYSSDGTRLRLNGNGLSTHHYPKAVFLSAPIEKGFNDLELNLNLVHELGHQALMAYQCVDPIIHGDKGTPLYSVIRRENRPAILAFHALIAVAYMVEYCMCRSLRARRTSEKSAYLLSRYQELTLQLQQGLREAIKIDYTLLGRKLLKECTSLYLTAANDLNGQRAANDHR